MRRVILAYPRDNFAKRNDARSPVAWLRPERGELPVPAVRPVALVPFSHEVGMTDSPRRDVPDPTQPLPYGNPGYSDPAYSNQARYGSPYQPPASANHTQQLPPYGYDRYPTDQFGPPYSPGGAPPEPPENGKGPRLWLLVLAAVSLVIVIGSVIALVIVNSSQQQTVVAPE